MSRLPKDFDITLGELLEPEGRWLAVLEKIREEWVGDDVDRLHNVRCGTMYVKEGEGNGDNGEVRLVLRFPLK